MENLSRHITYIHLGSNQGNKFDNLETAIAHIQKRIGEVTQKSSLYTTAAWGKTNQPDFINQAIEVKTFLSPINMMETLLMIENEMGRLRKVRWGKRKIDLDLIFYDDCIIESDILIIPHPRMHIRNFVLIPLKELIPDYSHPIFKQSIRELYAWCQDELKVVKLS